MLCEQCHKEISDNALFCTECGHPVAKQEPLRPDTVGTPVPAPAPSPFVPASFAQKEDPAFAPAPSAPQPFVPVSYAAPQSVFSAAPAMAFQAPAPAIYSNPVDESDFYHIDATEKYDFEGLRGLSIVMLVLSFLSIVGILCPMPLCIISLVKSIGGVEERNQQEASRSFSLCKTLLIISAALLVLIYFAFIIWVMVRAGDRLYM